MKSITTRPPTPLPRPTRERINRLVHWAALRHEAQLKADVTHRLIEARAAGGFDAIAPALKQIETELGGGIESLEGKDMGNRVVSHSQNKTPISAGISKWQA